MNGRLSKLLVVAVVLAVGSISTITLVPMMTSKTNEKTVAMIDKVGDTKKAPSTSVQSVIKSIGTSAQSGTVPGVGLNIDTNSWYTDMPGIKGDTSSSVDLGGFKLYKNPPWDSTSDTFYMNVLKAKEDYWNYLTKLGAKDSVYHGSLQEVLNNSFSVDVAYVCSNARSDAKTPDGSKSCGAKYKKIDGVDCCYMCITPAMVDKKYVTDKHYDTSNSWSKTNEGALLSKLKFCAVMTKKGNDLQDQSKYLYLPCIKGDAKGHTYPWGIVQTSVAQRPNNRLEYWKEQGGGTQTKTVGPPGDEDTIKKAITEMQTNNGNLGILSYINCTAEVVAFSSTWVSLLQGYVQVGWLMYC